jgi:hypothetical protein
VPSKTVDDDVLSKRKGSKSTICLVSSTKHTHKEALIHVVIHFPLSSHYYRFFIKRGDEKKEVSQMITTMGLRDEGSQSVAPK